MKLSLSNKARNKLVRSRNGNEGNNILKIQHWNLGSRHWHRKRTEIEALLQESEPDLLFISEANMNGGDIRRRKAH